MSQQEEQFNGEEEVVEAPVHKVTLVGLGIHPDPKYKSELVAKVDQHCDVGRS